MGGSAGASPEATGVWKRVAEARREQLVLYVIRGYRDPDLTLHATLSLEQVGLGSTVPHGCQSWAQCRAQWPVTPAPSCLGWQGADVTPIPSATLLYCADVRLTLQEWLDALVGCHILSGKLVKAAVMGSMPSRPRASR